MASPIWVQLRQLFVKPVFLKNECFRTLVSSELQPRVKARHQ